MKKRYIFNPETLMYEKQDLPAVLRYGSILLSVVVVLGMVYFFSWLYLDYFHLDLPKTMYLKAKTAGWESKVSILSHQVEYYDDILSGMEQRDNKVYRSIYGLNEIPAESAEELQRRAARFSSLDVEGANPAFKKVLMNIDALSKRAVVCSRSLDEIKQISQQAGDMISCVPAVSPLMTNPGDFRLSSSFGWRRDPVYGGHAFHEGQDFAGKKGLPVYATGDGTVEIADVKFRGYGNEIVINHGYGYKTRYAHLNTIEVQPGMKVRRGERIGTLGSTGKSTGPHLHYEVLYKGSRVNPRSFYDLEMTPEEYKAMIDKVAEDSPRGKMASTSELLKKRD